LFPGVKRFNGGKIGDVWIIARLAHPVLIAPATNGQEAGCRLCEPGNIDRETDMYFLL